MITPRQKGRTTETGNRVSVYPRAGRMLQKKRWRLTDCVCLCMQVLSDVSIIYKSRYVWVEIHRDFHTSTTFNVYAMTTLTHTAAFGRVHT